MAESKPSAIFASDTLWKDIYIKLNTSKTNPLEKFWSLSLNQSQDVNNGIKFYTISDKYTSALSGYSVIGFYISIVYLIGRLLRMSISGLFLFIF